MKSFLLLLATVAGAALTTSCSTIELGKEFDLPRFQNGVQRTVTTRAQVQAWLGEPVATGISVDSNGRRYEEWIYYYGGGTLPAMRDASLKMLQVKFDEQGTVRAYTKTNDNKATFSGCLGDQPQGATAQA
ncbi:MAG: hypothetical protein ACE5ET_03635 [Gammaproteobacteria bacterium]